MQINVTLNHLQAFVSTAEQRSFCGLTLALQAEGEDLDAAEEASQAFDEPRHAGIKGGYAAGIKGAVVRCPPRAGIGLSLPRT